MTKNLLSLKVNQEGYDFLSKIMLNRRNLKIDKKDIGFYKVILLIAKYFKQNNDEYLEMIKGDIEKC